MRDHALWGDIYVSKVYMDYAVIDWTTVAFVHYLICAMIEDRSRNHETAHPNSQLPVQVLLDERFADYEHHQC